MGGVLLAVLVASTAAADLAEADGGRARARRLLNVVRDSVTDDQAPCVAYSEDVKPFVTCFDPSRTLELGGSAIAAADGVHGGFAVAVRLRGERDSWSKLDSTWLNLHRAAALEVRDVGGRPAFSVVGYQGHFRRHVREGVLLIPTTPPVRLPFPLDIALQAEALRYERRQAEGADWTLEPVRLGVLLDPLRSASGRFHLALGVTAAYRLRATGGALVHDITPLTAAALRLNLESEDGLWVARAEGVAGWTFAPGAVEGVLRARGEVELSRVVVALNDQPLSLVARLSGAWADAGAAAGSEVLVSVGARVSLFSARH